eukprot:4602851-Amphidinium_carterae.2
MPRCHSIISESVAAHPKLSFSEAGVRMFIVHRMSRNVHTKTCKTTELFIKSIAGGTYWGQGWGVELGECSVHGMFIEFTEQNAVKQESCL